MSENPTTTPAQDFHALLRAHLGGDELDRLVEQLAWSLKLENLRGGEEALATGLVAAHLGEGAREATAPAPLGVRRFLSHGELSPERIDDTDDVLDQAARLMEKGYAADILGRVVFEGANGRLYELSLSAVIDEVEPDDVAPLAEGRSNFHAEVVRPQEKNGNLQITGASEAEVEERLAEFIDGNLDEYLEEPEAGRVRPLLDAGRHSEAIDLFFELAEDLGLRRWATG